MPSSKIVKRRAPKIRRRKKRGYAYKQTILSSFPVPNMINVKLKYNDLFTYNGSVVDQVFNMNSLFDPDRTGTGHQPYGFDQLANFYNRYRVLAFSYDVIASITTGSGVITALASNDATALTSATLTGEIPLAKKQLIQYGMPVRLRGYVSLSKLNGCSVQAYEADDRFQALLTANPTEFQALHLVASTMTGAATNTISIDVTLTYHAQIFDPINLNQS